MSDLIRRMDAVQACQVGPSDEWSRSTKSGYNQAATDCAMNILHVPAALPAVQPDAAAIREAALLEAAEICRNYSMDDGSGMFDVHSAACEHSILALIDKPAHVNETPKSEHDARDVLTPGTKGGDACPM